jgi:hypothetical protein
MSMGTNVGNAAPVLPNLGGLTFPTPPPPPATTSAPPATTPAVPATTPAAQVAPGTPEEIAIRTLQSTLGQTFLDSLNGGVIPQGTEVKDADIARFKAIEESLPVGSPIRYNYEVVGRRMRQYRDTNR